MRICSALAGETNRATANTNQSFLATMRTASFHTEKRKSSPHQTNSNPSPSTSDHRCKRIEKPLTFQEISKRGSALTTNHDHEDDLSTTSTPSSFISSCDRAEQLEFIDSNRAKAVRRYDLDFQIPRFDRRESKLLVGVFEKSDVLSLKLA
jgi:hypothetical protein